MSLPALHPWTMNPDEAMQIQAGLRQHLKLTWDGHTVTLVAGVDVAFTGDQARAGIVLLRYPDLVPLVGITAEIPLYFPYIPGLLAFREGPAILAAWEKLPTKPDLLLFDGQGIAHPRGIGIASHLGLWLDTPTIGVAKSRLYGYASEVGPRFGDRIELCDERDPGLVIGAVLRTRQNSRPLYVSPGHLIDVEQAVTFVLACCRGHRLPEPTRWAHQLATGLPPAAGA